METKSPQHPAFEGDVVGYSKDTFTTAKATAETAVEAVADSRQQKQHNKHKQKQKKHKHKRKQGQKQEQRSRSRSSRSDHTTLAATLQGRPDKGLQNSLPAT